jgi:hypothetical protein
MASIVRNPVDAPIPNDLGAQQGISSTGVKDRSETLIGFERTGLKMNMVPNTQPLAGREHPRPTQQTV